MILDVPYSPALAKHLREGHLDLYVLHVGGVDKVIVRTMPRKSSAYQNAVFRNVANSATLTNNAYRSLTDSLKGACGKFHKNLDDSFLDHFRSGIQSVAYATQAPPAIFTTLEIDPVTQFPKTQIRFFRPYACRLTINYKRNERENYIYHTSNRSRGIVCPKDYYLRPWEQSFDLNTQNEPGWTQWIKIAPKRELELFCKPPTITSPKRPWFGPYPIEKILEFFSAFFV